MAADSNLVLQASVTKTSTFNSVGVDLHTGTPRRGLTARVLYSAAANASGANSVVFSIQHGATLGGTYYALASGAADTLALTTAAQAGEIFIPFETSLEFVRLVCTIADTGSGSTPTVTYSGAVLIAHP